MAPHESVREDLYYRVSAVTVRLPALRERPKDLPLPAEHLLRQAAEREGKPAREWTQEAMRRLLAHSWPGWVFRTRSAG